MELAVFTTLLRSAILAFGVFLVNDGKVTNDQLDVIAGFIIAVIPVIWGVMKNSKYFPKVKV
jgi:hypothetical protein